ncbi:diaminobutyrate acetyltransferase [Pseudonocardia lacus]|uniref:diaminobutyrate acetyltransferase n=1 Tax=Pseudonocardia lacus TaxID=2835865 RepID=UPI001BDCFE3F|nr:diaminobutyrate acetyltransferase [Pseudonocardia lacus]
MTDTATPAGDRADTAAVTPAGVTVRRPGVSDGAACWRLACASGIRSVNSRYAYLLWARDFDDTSAVAWRRNAVVGFTTGFRRPDEPSTLFVWQVVVAEAVRGRGVGAAMLDVLVDRLPDVDHVEASVAPDDPVSQALFTGFATRYGAAVSRSLLFGSDLLGPGRPPEVLVRIGPLRR